MDWNVGIGIGLQGRPPMFEGVARAREAAAQQYQAKKQAQKASKLDKTEQAFLRSIQGKNYLPIDEQRVNEGLSEVLDLFEQESESPDPDMNSISRAAANAVQLFNRADEQRNRMIRIFDKPQANGLSEDDVRIIMSNSDPKKLNEQLALFGSGGVGYNEETGEFYANSISNFAGTQEFAAKFIKDGGDRLFTDSLPDEQFTFNNKTFRGRAINPQMRDVFIASRLSGENLEMVRREMNMSVYRGKPKPERGSEEEMAAMVEYVGNVYDQNIAPQRIYDSASLGKPIEVNIDLGKKDVSGDGFLPKMNVNVYEEIAKPLGVDLSTTSIMGFMVPEDKRSGISIPTNTFNVDTGERITKTGGTVISSKIDVVPVYTGPPIDIPVSGTSVAGTIKLKPGMIVPDELIYNFADMLKQNFEYKKISFTQFRPTGAEERGTINIYYPSTYVEESIMEEKSPKKAKELRESMAAFNKMVKENKNFTPRQIEQYKKTLEEGGAVLDVPSATPSTGPGGNLKLKNSTSEDRMKALENM